MSTPDAKRLLVVDDDPGLLRLIQKTLDREGYSCATAASGSEAIKSLERAPADLLLLDLKLQDAKAGEVIERLASIGCRIPFVIITGQGDERVAVDMMKRGALDYVVKDANFLEFLPTVVSRAIAQIEREHRLALVEGTLRENERRFRETLDAMMEGCQTLGFDWRYLYVNAAAARHGRRTTTELLGKTMMEVYPGIERTPIFLELAECMRNRNPRNLENEFHYGDGKSAWFQLSIQPVPEGLFILSLDITKRKEAEREREKLEREMLEISHQEQNRLGRDLHDGLGQQLTALELFSVSLAAEADSKSRILGKKVRKMGEHLREAIKQTRAMANGLSPVSPNEGGLTTALTKLAEATCTMANVDCRFIYSDPLVIGSEPSIHLYRIAQEATNNALKHGAAKIIRIALTIRDDGQLQLSVTDNGRGFVPSEAKSGGMGLRVIQYRAGLIGAELHVDSEPAKGTCVTCVMRKYV